MNALEIIRSIINEASEQNSWASICKYHEAPLRPPATQDEFCDCGSAVGCYLVSSDSSRANLQATFLLIAVHTKILLNKFNCIQSPAANSNLWGYIIFSRRSVA